MRTLQRSMDSLRKAGWICAKAEHWNAFARLRQDLFGFIDIVALSPKDEIGPGIIYAIQVVNTHLAEHIVKIQTNEAAQRWLDCEGVILIHNWKQRSKNKVKYWECEVIEVTP